MILLPCPSWLPAAVTPVDWFVVQVLGILLLSGLIFGVRDFIKKGGCNE